MARKQHKPRLSRDARREKRNKKLMSYVLVILMIVSVAGIWASSTSQNSNYKSYGDFKFDVRPEASLNNQYVYFLKGDTSSLFFYSLPQDTLKIKTFGNLSDVLSKADFFVLSTENNPHYLSFYDQLRFDMNQYVGKQSVGAFLEPYDSLLEIPVITCENASVEMPVIELRIANKSEIIANPSGCILMNVEQGNVALIRDRLLYSGLGIIND